MIRAHLLVEGHVQGVYFRASAQKEAQRLGLAGWVRNRSGGDVEAVAEGSQEAVEAFVAWCRHGPGSARVDGVDVDLQEATGRLVGFEVRPSL